MTKNRKILQNTCAVLLLSTSAVQAQSACESYEVKLGDTLSSIARSTYQNHKMYRQIYRENIATIGPNINLIEVGMPLNLPCLPGTEQEAEVVVPTPLVTPIEKPEETEPTAEPKQEAVVAMAPSENEPVVLVPASKAISMVTGNNYAPFTDETLPGGGIFTQLVEKSIYRSDPERHYNLTFINDWQAHLDALLPSGAYDLSFPWSRPNCEEPNTLASSDLNRCENFVFSKPLYEIVDGFFVMADGGLHDATAYTEFSKKRICRPEGYTMEALNKVGLTSSEVDVIQPTTPEECFTALTQGTVDIVALDADVATALINKSGFENKVVQNPHLTTVKTLHIIAYKSNEEAIGMIAEIDKGIAQMYETGEWYDLVSTILARNNIHKEVEQ
jgi:polar amino acid transport system substrate-binding protein